MPCSEPLHVSHSADYICDFCPLPGPDVVPSVLVCAVVHTSLRVGLCGRKFVLCLFGECPGVDTSKGRKCLRCRKCIVSTNYDEYLRS